MKFVVVYNPRSGSSLSQHDLDEHFRDAKLDVIEYVDVTKDLAEQLNTYRGTTDIAIAAYGGDGTLSSVASVLTDLKLPFAPLPGGTLNHFTKDLGISQDLDDALSHLTFPRTQHVDIAKVNDKYFLNNSSIGLYPAMLRQRDELQRNAVSKWTAATLSSISALIKYRRYDISIDKETIRTPFVFIGNNNYRLEESLTGNRLSLSEGVLSVYTVTSLSRWALFNIVIKTLLGIRPADSELQFWQTTSVTIKVRKSRIRVSRDGEHELLEAPLSYTLEPKALSILY